MSNPSNKPASPAPEQEKAKTGWRLTYDNPEFGQRLAKLRKAAGLNQAKAAKAAGRSLRLWQMWEAGQRIPLPPQKIPLTDESLWRTAICQMGPAALLNGWTPEELPEGITEEVLRRWAAGDEQKAKTAGAEP